MNRTLNIPVNEKTAKDLGEIGIRIFIRNRFVKKLHQELKGSKDGATIAQEIRSTIMNDLAEIAQSEIDLIFSETKEAIEKADK